MVIYLEKFNSIPKKGLIYIFYSCLYKILLELASVYYVLPKFIYSGFDLDITLSKLIISWITYFGLLIIYPNKLRKPSDFLMTFKLFIILTPILSYYALSNSNTYHLFTVLFGSIITLYSRHLASLRIPLLKKSKPFAVYISVTMVFLITAWLIYVRGFSGLDFNIFTIYDRREDISQSINVGIFSYGITWLTKVIGPFLLTFTLWKKKRYYIFLIIILSVLWFGFTAHKSVLFNPFLVLLVYFWLKKSQWFYTIPLTFSFFITIGFFLYNLTSFGLILSYLIRRSLMVPALLTFKYYEFFSENPYVFWSNSFTSGFINYPYNLPPPELISNYLGAVGHANNSYLSTGYMHAGIIGVVLYGVIVGILFSYIDRLIKYDIPSWVIVCSLIVPVKIIITSVDLTTGLLTHGLFLSIILVTLLRSRRFT